MSNTAAVIPEAKAQLKLEKRSIPKPKAGEIVVKNQAIAINPGAYLSSHLSSTH